MNMIKLVRFTVASLFIAVVAGTWDAWWHGAVGRETLFEPPHLLLYAATTLAILGGVYGWYITREKVWRRLAAFLLLVPVSAPFDELWHRAFGIEDLTSILIVWSPPHIALIVGIVGSLVLILPLIRRDKDLVAQRFFGAAVFAAVLQLLLFLAVPLQPFSPYNLIGFWGAGVVSFLFVGILLLAKKWIPGLAGATLMTIFFIFLASLGFGEQTNPDIVIQPHPHYPPWLSVFSFILPAVFIDMQKKLPLWLQGGLAGAIWSLVLYGFASRFFESEFQYISVDVITAVFASAVGGIIAGLIISAWMDKSK